MMRRDIDVSDALSRSSGAGKFSDQPTDQTGPPPAKGSCVTRSVPAWFYWVVVVLDGLTLVLVIIFAAWGRANLPILGFTEDRTEQITYDSVRLTGAYVLFGWLLAIAGLGGYTRRNMGTGTGEISRLLRASLVTAAAIGIGCYLFKFPLSRGFFVLLFLTGIPTLVFGRLIVRRFVESMHVRGRWSTRVIVAGTPMTIDDVAKVLARETRLGYSVVGAVTPRFWGEERTPDGHRVIGHTEDLVTLVTGHAASTVIFVAPSLARRTIVERRGSSPTTISRWSSSPR